MIFRNIDIHHYHDYLNLFRFLPFFLEKGVQFTKLLCPANFIFGEWYWAMYSM